MYQRFKMNEENTDVFENLMQEDKPKEERKDLDVLKELFILKNIESKTELNINQIILINQKRTIAELLDFDDLRICLNDFMILMVSHKRAGRREFVEGFKAEREQNVKASGSGFFGGLRSKLNL